ncbi:lactoylglutathione lyase family protein [Labilibaculum sp. DW002]|uniref:Lactoylglutathione lyase family protein n=1 Tax=Paralabilibaculum antarcticum TaxID=2912572 RepID=A0ABT5VNF5_9BACT|nr:MULTISPECIES: lactoylglutathione lyase family protein [unclassified Labilibaculum]MBI9058619.1 lactoylglutathione lyase family protein [Labilibaculum sp.]MDE5416791.1 lactoylglutathione lyase family protein [Labilibaculum sp. DW002]
MKVGIILLMSISLFFSTNAEANKKDMKEEKKEYPRAFSHIGITVPDLDKAVAFYTEVMGFYIIMPPTEVVEENETAIGQMCIDVFGKGWETFRIAHLSTGDRIGIELFEFKESKEQKPTFEPFKTGLFHFSVQDPDVEGLVAKIVEHGGKQRMPIREYYPGDKPYRMCYVEDPFGNVFEIYSHSYELHYSPGAYK